MSDKLTDFIGGLTEDETLELTKLALQNLNGDKAIDVVVDWATDATLLEDLADAVGTAQAEEAEDEDEETK